MAQVLAVEAAVFRQCLGKADFDGVAALRILHPHPEPSGDVLAQIDYRCIAVHGDALRTDCLQYLHVGGHRSAQRSRGDCRAFGAFPLLVVVSRSGPALELLPGIVDFSVVFVVGADGTVGVQLPLRVGGYGFLRAVFKFYNDVRTELGIAEVGYLVWFLLLLHGVVSAVAECHTDGIVLLEHGCHVEGVVEHGLAVVCRCRRKHLFAHFPSVDVCLIHAQSADVERGAPHRLVYRELPAQIARGQAAVYLLPVPRLCALEANPLSAPVRFGKKSNIPHRHVAPPGCALAGLHLHTPVAWRVAAQRFAGIVNPLRLVGTDLRIP